MNQSDQDLKVAFGKIIAARREKLGLTQEQLADRCGTARNYVGELERGEKQPTLTSLFAVAEALESTPAELMKVLQKNIK